MKNKYTTKDKITKDMNFVEIMSKYPEVVEILFEKGMHCIGCPMAMQETFEQGALAHGLDPDKLIKKINRTLFKKKIKSKKTKDEDEK